MRVPQAVLPASAAGLAFAVCLPQAVLPASAGLGFAVCLHPFVVLASAGLALVCLPLAVPVVAGVVLVGALAAAPGFVEAAVYDLAVAGAAAAHVVPGWCLPSVAGVPSLLVLAGAATLAAPYLCPLVFDMAVAGALLVLAGSAVVCHTAVAAGLAGACLPCLLAGAAPCLVHAVVFGMVVADLVLGTVGVGKLVGAAMLALPPYFAAVAACLCIAVAQAAVAAGLWLQSCTPLLLPMPTLPGSVLVLVAAVLATPSAQGNLAALG